MDLSQYESRLGGATTLAEGFLNTTATVANENFSKPMSYRKVLIDSVEADCQFKRGKKSNAVTITLRPYTKVFKGMYVFFEGKNYLVKDFTPNEIFPKCEIEMCNNTLRWRDDFGLKEYWCVVKGDSFEVDDDKSIIISDSELTVTVPYNDDTSSILPDQRFVFGKFAYSVSSVNSLSDTILVDGKIVGLMTLRLASSETTDTDDTDTGVADDKGNSGWGDW